MVAILFISRENFCTKSSEAPEIALCPTFLPCPQLTIRNEHQLAVKNLKGSFLISRRHCEALEENKLCSAEDRHCSSGQFLCKVGSVSSRTCCVRVGRSDQGRVKVVAEVVIV